MFLAKMFLVAGTIAAALLTSAPAVTTEQIPERPPSATSPALRQIVRQLVRDGAPGALAVVRTPLGIRRAQAGLARRRPRTAMVATDRFRVASITKTFVATVVLQLVAEGKLGLDDPVERWLPGLVPNGRAITIRELLDHTSGLFNYFGRQSLRPSGRGPTRPHLAAAQTRRDCNLAPAPVPARPRLVVLEHQLHPARPRRRGGERNDARAATRTTTLPAARAHRDVLPDRHADRRRTCRRLHRLRDYPSAAFAARHLAGEPLSRLGGRRESSPPATTSPASTPRSSAGGCSPRSCSPRWRHRQRASNTDSDCSKPTRPAAAHTDTRATFSGTAASSTGVPTEPASPSSWSTSTTPTCHGASSRRPPKQPYALDEHGHDARGRRNTPHHASGASALMHSGFDGRPTRVRVPSLPLESRQLRLPR